MMFFVDVMHTGAEKKDSFLVRARPFSMMSTATNARGHPCQFGREAGAYDIFFRSVSPLYEQFQLCKLKNKLQGV